MILHITTRKQWQEAASAGVYRSDTLASEGFIHCSTRQQLIPVANNLYAGWTDLVLLCLDPHKVQADIRYEGYEAGGERFPHIYGPLNLDAVVQVFDFSPNEDGSFTLPAGIR